VGVLKLNARNIPFVNIVKYFGVIFDWGMTWKLPIDRTAAKALATYTRIHSLFKSEYLGFNIKLTLHDTPIISVKIVYFFHLVERGARLLRETTATADPCYLSYCQF
jgi:hypothetical protein